MIELEVDNYRALRRVRCSFDVGITVVVGANGAGKSTLLDVPSLLRHAATYGLREALAHHGGLAARSWGVREADVRLQLRHAGLRWELQFANEGESLADLRERLWLDHGPEPYATQGIGDVIVRVGQEGLGLFGGGPAAWALARARRAERAADFAVVDQARAYTDYDVRGLRVRGSASEGQEDHLHLNGRNLFQVIRGWRDQPRGRARHEFVTGAMRTAFPGFRDLAFSDAGPVVFGGFVFESDLERMQPALTSANGLLVALLHLAAVASAPRGGYVGLDELENALHPFAIRSLLDAIDDYARREQLAVVIATHSPVVLDHLQGSPERILVPSRDDPRGFVPLTDVEERDYLNDFSLGRMYSRGKYGSQTP